MKMFCFIFRLDPCLSSPCKNAGVCKAGNTTGSYVCDCEKGFLGKNCGNSRFSNDMNVNGGFHVALGSFFSKILLPPRHFCSISLGK